MSDQAWLFLGLVVSSLAGILGAVAGLVAASRSGRAAGAANHASDTASRAESAAGDAATAASAARDFSEPTGNGYASTTTSTLERIEKKVDAVGSALLQHLQDHTRSALDRGN